MEKLLFLLITFSSNLWAYSVTTSWTTPTKRIDGTAMKASEISHYILGYGTTPSNYTTQIKVASSPFVVNNLTFGVQFYFVVKAVDTNGQESDWSNEDSLPIPKTPTGLRLVSYMEEVFAPENEEELKDIGYTAAGYLHGSGVNRDEKRQEIRSIKNALSHVDKVFNQLDERETAILILRSLGETDPEFSEYRDLSL